ncbi:hypothetical protein CO115_04725 [Candidatus Falkowbacteria bacterium CG_4_9_14_3_um_filter_36_9]|uniref:O-antigen ligase-related domain-containing protein n=1 Tax=Candidatus Falkowbacteria bacterium CG1_02_37_44 TaxID=1805146 RepID=A0A1J4TBD0_9BACT|nr:MAG: hypothetical protein AUJ27_02290 [Candidatus Falkowbacteria bacterium CG1_02_37_44]PIX12386.1 MAG: hypothetical protein COZ73_00270 [Candidatus Falkowbacteria bacterium CG_4_8_14_3_um_filter_36_11]PJA10382.1 MAG: hypothetical protein COX67_04710 [Candidatus Falkowbacteria bacterium CG_4_10_14_0_2_um_filter_36_22]PJB18355.1 MAG: hypothetical protein CO115_04725 [Candidatus Falkowbacteria bacterium CG_4_9_14_3_um_filter_36_9]
MNILILIFCILYFILAYKRLDWAVMFIIAALPSYLIRFSIFNIPFTLLEAMILIAFFVWFSSNYKEIINNIKLRSKNNWKLEIACSLFARGKADGRRGNWKLSRYPFDIEIVLLLIISYLATAVSGFNFSALGIWKAYFFEPVLFFILVLNIFNSKKGIDKIIFSLSVSAFLVSVFAIYQKFTGAFIFNELWAATSTRRITSFFGYPNAVGLYLGPAVLLLLGWIASKISNYKIQRHLLQNKKLNFQFSTRLPDGQVSNSKIIYIKILAIILTLILAIMAIYFARSEGALIGIILGLIIFGLLTNKKSLWATIFFIIVVTVGIFLYQPAEEYILNKLLLRDLSGQIRRQQWQETWQMLSDGRIITGAGLANYQKTLVPYHTDGFFVRDYKDPDWHKKTLFNEAYRKKVWQPLEIYLYPHNIFLNFWSELGIAGMLLFIWIFIKFYYLGIKLFRISDFRFRISKNNQSDKFMIIGLLGSMAVFLVHGLVDVPYFKNDLAAVFWILISILGIIKISEEYKQNGG